MGIFRTRFNCDFLSSHSQRRVVFIFRSKVPTEPERFLLVCILHAHVVNHNEAPCQPFFKGSRSSHPQLALSRGRVGQEPSGCQRYRRRPGSSPPAFFLTHRVQVSRVFRVVQTCARTFGFREHNGDDNEIHQVQADEHYVELPCDLGHGQR